VIDDNQVIVDHHDSEARYRLLEVVRQYAAELLRESGEDEVVRAHHLDWYRQLAERSSATLRGPDQTLWLSVLERELGNLRAAGRWALESGAAEAALQLGGACGYFCQIRGHLFRSEARAMLDQALARCSELPTPPAVDVRARALYWAGTFAMEQFDYPRAAEALEESLRQWRELEDHAQVAEALIGLGALARARGDFERSEVMLTEAMTLARTHAAPTSLGRALRFMGAIARERGEARRAADLDRESIEVFRTTGESHQVGHVLDQLGEALLDLTEYDAALQAHLESVPLLRAAGCEEGVNSSIYHQARLAWARGDAQTALALAVDSLGVYQRLGVRRDVAGCLDLVAQLCSKQMPDRSARLFGAAEALRQELVVSLAPADRAARDATVRALRALLGTEFARHYEDGEALPLDRAVDEALAVQLSAAAAEASGEPQAASGDMLSAREREVAELIAEGLTNREIADRLVIAPRTAEAHVTHLLNKLGLRSRSQVAVWVVNHSRPR
jgi:DNA-binding CsgD family transcriptional regulator/tetratricopeptide (TPR) repeat protein